MMLTRQDLCLLHVMQCADGKIPCLPFDRQVVLRPKQESWWMRSPPLTVGGEVADEQSPAHGSQVGGYAAPAQLPQRIQINYLHACAQSLKIAGLSAALEFRSESALMQRK